MKQYKVSVTVFTVAVSEEQAKFYALQALKQSNIAFEISEVKENN